MFKRLLDGDQMKKFIKICDDMHVNLSLAITEDQGKGSIFKHIEEINEYVSKRLFAKIDLTRRN